ncbi:HAD hydrolase-like protein [bacterium]|nr:HAD hydrolase-like protein [bacterium]
MTKRTTFVLFDIDGTLIDPGAAGRRSITRAFEELFSIKDTFGDIRMAGKTDIQIAKEGLAAHGLPSGDDVISSIKSEYIRILKTEIKNKRKRLLPGVMALLDVLNKKNGYRLGLLTGNIEPGARIKLGAFNLNSFFPVGAFGDDDEDRNHLLPIALKKFKLLTGIDLHYSDCVVVGDTPSDVRCSKPFGAISVAVSTGSYSYEALLETGADYVLKDLTQALEDVDQFRRP